MKAVILVGGKATRLLPLTANVPKAMVPVVNEPFIGYAIRNLVGHGLKDIVLAQGHLAQPIESYLGDGAYFGARLTYSFEDKPLGTAGAFKNAERFVDGTFAGLNGDIFTDLDLAAMIDFHKRRGAVATISLTPVEDPTAYGLVETDTEGRVRRFLEKPKPEEITTNMINAGTYILEPSVLDLIPPGVSVSIEREVFPRLLSEGKPVYGFASTAYWLDFGTIDKYRQLHADVLAGKSRFGVPLADGVAVGEGARIDPTARIDGPVVIGAGCRLGPRVRVLGPTVIGEGAEVAADSSLESSVAWRALRLGEGARVSGSVIANNCRIEAGCVVEQAVLGDGVLVRSGARVPPGSKIEPGTVVQ